MRYRLEKAETEDKNRLKATCWWRDVCWEKVLDDEKHSADFSFDKEGLEETIVWLNQIYEEGKAKKEQEE